MAPTSFLYDLRTASRSLARGSGVSAAAVLTLAVCLAAAISLFSVIESVLLDPWPYDGFDRVVTFRGSFPLLGERERWQWSVPEYQDIASQTQIFDHAIAGRGRTLNLTEDDLPERVRAAEITADAFTMLGVEPALGRVFAPEEDRPGGPRVLVMSHGLWQRRFGGDPEIVGAALEIEGESYTVLGVMPDRFRWWGSDLWLPLQLDTTAADRADRRLTVQAWLAEEVDLERAEAELEHLARRWEGEHGATVEEYRGFGFRIRLLERGVLGEVRPALYALLGFVALVFLVGCANVANLLMARAVERRSEIAVRTALGSGRTRLVRSLLLEVLLLSLAAGGLGFLLALGAVELIVALIPPVYIPAETEIDVDRWSLLFALLSSALAAVLCGWGPALHALKVSHGELVSGSGGRGGAAPRTGRLRSALVVAEVALATVLLIAAGLMIRTFTGLTAVDPGFEPQNVLTLGVSLPEDRYGEPHRVDGFFGGLTERVERLAGVESVSATTSLPLRGGTPSATLTLEGESSSGGAIPSARGRVVRPGYFDTLEIPLLRGRDFQPADNLDSAPVAIINRSMAERFWGTRDPLGRRFKLGRADSERPWRTVVGVVGNVADSDLEEGAAPLFYMPHGQRADRVRSLTLVVRTGVPPEELVEPIRREVQRIDRLQPVHDVATLERIHLESLGATPLAATLLSVFAVLALGLAAVGIFAVMAFSVSRRTAEIGVRMALGADRGRVVGGLLRRGLEQTALGVGIGLVAGALAARALSGFVYGVSTLDPTTFAVAALLFCVLGALGSYLPARRAARVDPAFALRRGASS